MSQIDINRVTSIKPGGVFMKAHQFSFYILINNIEMYDQTPFDSRRMCASVMRADVERLRRDHGV